MFQSRMMSSVPVILTDMDSCRLEASTSKGSCNSCDRMDTIKMYNHFSSVFRYNIYIYIYTYVYIIYYDGSNMIPAAPNIFPQTECPYTHVTIKHKVVPSLDEVGVCDVQPQCARSLRSAPMMQFWSRK